MASLALTGQAWSDLLAHIEGAAPLEACGSLLGPADAPGLSTRAVPIRNVHEAPRRGFSLDVLEHLAALRQAAGRGEVERAVYHSHVEGPAWLSPEDERGALLEDGRPRLPGEALLVVSVRAGRATEARIFRFDEDRRRFVGEDLPIPGRPT